MSSSTPSGNSPLRIAAPEFHQQPAVFNPQQLGFRKKGGILKIIDSGVQKNV
jgi:hypothetical protein